jgi:hypothetical protein
MHQREVIIDDGLFDVKVSKYCNLVKSLILAGLRPIRPRFPPSEHHPEKWGAGVPKRSCPDKKSKLDERFLRKVITRKRPDESLDR